MRERNLNPSAHARPARAFGADAREKRGTMSTVRRIFVEKKPEYAHEARFLATEIRELLGIESLAGLRVVNRYDAEIDSRELFDKAVATVFSEPQVDLATETLDAPGSVVFAVEYLPGQFDQRADSAAQCIQIVSCGERPLVRSATVYVLEGKLSDAEVSAIKTHVINPVEAREASLDLPESLELDWEEPAPVATLERFVESGDAEALALRAELGLAMDDADFLFLRAHFRAEGRNPTLTEVRVVDTYWSDHCRHTTFTTEIDAATFADPTLEAAYQRYLALRGELGRDSRPVTLMDIATIAVRHLSATGRLDGLDESEEINACTVKISVRVNGVEQPWLLLFKNETHNHPTEIEPFGGAATCIGGAIRDPLSGRSYVYGAMRLTGAADPTVPLAETMEGKIPQRQIVQGAARGYSSYGNQIGLATGIVDEIYHPGYAAKHMEIGAVIAAAPAANVRRERPEAGNVVILLGGATGRDGIGGATGSSKAHDVNSVAECGAEVQKGNAPEERKIQRLFRNPEAALLIRRCNDFGAGGVCVAIGELAPGLDIDLDAVPRKYEGLDGTELAISESQERMAVVVEAGDAERFIELADAENLCAVPVARVTAEERLVMRWRGQTIVDIPRSFLDTNGAPKNIEVEPAPAAWNGPKPPENFAAGMRETVGSLQNCSRRGLGEAFDSTIGTGTVLMPYGGRRQLTPIQAMAHKISVEHGDTDTCSLMSWGFNPDISSQSPYHGAYLAVVESLAKLVATGGGAEASYLSFQEYFERLGTDPRRWGRPFAAVLGGFEAQMDLGVGAIGGKDSMSGSFGDLDVPPTLVSFAVTTADVDDVVSPEFKRAGSKVAVLAPEYRDGGLPEPESLKAVFAQVRALADAGLVRAACTPGAGGIADAVFRMCLGNGFGFEYAPGWELGEIFGYLYGAFVLELGDGADVGVIPGARLLGSVLAAEEIRRDGTSLPMGPLVAGHEGRLEGVYRTDVPGGSAALRGGGDEVGRMSGGGDADGCGRGAVERGGDGTSLPMGPLVARHEGRSASDAGTQGQADRVAKGQTDGVAPETFTFAGRFDGAPAVACARPRFLIPVFPGTNCEYDTAKAVEAAGGQAEVFIVRNRDAEAVSRSVEDFAKRMADAQAVFIPGGFSGGDEPDGSGKFITAFFRNEAVAAGTGELLDARGGLMAGICNGFQALVKLGLVPYGKIVEPRAGAPTLTFNTIGRHQSKIVRTRIASAASPWLRFANPGEVYSVPISHGEGRFVACEQEIRALAAAGQIATQYADEAGEATMDIRFNPNGSVHAVEGITSPDGRVFGKMGHSERVGSGLYRNVPGRFDLRMFDSAVGYFRG